MSAIRLLPDGVVNKIAAGEVVERPASVLKELLENAVDAGGAGIEAEVSGAFPFTIRVSDRGCGMTAEEAALAIRRHTTSKIGTAEDLHRIVTYGFRGEALPSIASVSRLRIVTRPAGQDAATEIVVEGGVVKSVREAGAPPGTTVEVTDLFGNVPARRKFLKTPRTEMSRLWEVFHAAAIPGEGISFRMTDGRTEGSYDAAESRLDRAVRHADDDAKYLVRVDGPSAFFRVAGWAGLPHLSRFGSSGIHFFVNGRHFRDKAVFGALREAYRGIIPADRQPVAYLFITCDPSEVDVNVHPGKAEVRFRYGRELFELVRHAIREALGDLPLPAGDERPAPVFRAGPRAADERAGDVALFAPGEMEPEAPGGTAVRFSLPAPSAGTDLFRGAGFSSLRPVGQLLGTYIVCEGAGEVVVIDQHAADERIVFSRLKDSYLGKSAPIQRWLVPQVVTLAGAARKERSALETFLSATGFIFEGFGEDTFKLTGGPAILGPFDVRRWWDDLCEFLDSQGSAPKGIFDADRELWRMACHASVRGGQTLEKEGMRALLHELDRAVAAHSCPHGRPVWVRISGGELGRMFGRT